MNNIIFQDAGVTVINPKRIVSDLQITWKKGLSFESNKRLREAFRNIKSVEAAQNILAKRVAKNMKCATWNGRYLVNNEASIKRKSASIF